MEAIYIDGLAVVDEASGVAVTLLDGEVVLSNEQGELAVQAGEQGLVSSEGALSKRPVLEAINIIQWALYYPAVLDVNELVLADQDVAEFSAVMQTYGRGDLLGALAAYPADRQPRSDAERVMVAALWLGAGQVEAAELQLAGMTRASALGEALLELMAAVKQRSQLDPRAPTTASGWLARSYSWQAQSDLGSARRAADRATAISPEFGAAWIRRAELEFGFGEVRAARASLERGLKLSPLNAQGLALRGFVAAAEGAFVEAESWFEKAVAQDGGLGNAWLGRGLTRIRGGRVEEGRKDLQVAAALEPQRSLLRSYLGKALIEEGRWELGAKELELASRLDPADPTPRLYSALMRQQRNEINQAVQDLEDSQELNDNRSVFRSRLLLDQDQAVRSANLASIYRDAAMLDLSAREAARAVNYDYANYSAHLFLANSYDALRDPKLINLRYETAWFSELLVAQLLAPVGASSLSQSISQQEYGRFFDRDHLGLYSSTEYQSSGDWVQKGSQYGTLGNSSYAVDVFYRTENGQRPNNDLEQFGLSGRFKQQLTPRDSLFFEASYFNLESGDVAQYFDQAMASPVQRVKEWQEPNLLAGYHHEWRPGVHTLFLGGRLDDRFELSGNATIYNLIRGPGGNILGGFSSIYPVDYESDFEAYTAELQQIWQKGAFTAVAGARYQTGETEVETVSPAVQEFETDLERLSLYAYTYWQVWEPLQLMAGLSYDQLEYPNNIDLPPVRGGEQDKNRVSPKAGFYYTPRAGTVFRGVYSQSLGGLFYDTSVRLEPTQIAGFNQAFRSIIPESVSGLVPGSEFETLGLAWDQRFATRTYLSVMGEILYSEADRQVGTFDLGIPSVPSSTRQDLSYRERSVTVTLDQLLGDHWSIGGYYRLREADLRERFDEFTPALAGAAERDLNGLLHQVDLHANYHLPCGFFSQWNSVWSTQSVRGYAVTRRDDFWQHHVLAGYRFFHRRAEAAVGLLNIFDRDYRLDPVTLYNELPRERTFVARLKFYF